MSPLVIRQAARLAPRTFWSPVASVPESCVRPLVRRLTLDDLSALNALEDRKWEVGQRASISALVRRIEEYPELSLGAFCTRGTALASLFLRPVDPAALLASRTWLECAEAPPPIRSGASGALFGISLSSIRPEAVRALFEYFWPFALRHSFHEVWLGSPMPGLADWLARRPKSSAIDYARQHDRRGLPMDPQLRYYRRRGFTDLVAVKPGYFPHAGSCDFAALLRGRVPLAFASAMWRRLPHGWTEFACRQSAVLL